MRFAGKRSAEYPAWAIITCLRCELPFMVRINEFLKPRKAAVHKEVTIRGKTCPYCQQTALPPARKDLK